MHAPETIKAIWDFFEASLLPLPEALRSEHGYERALLTWCALLADLTPEQLAVGASVWATTAGNRFFPTSAQLRDAALSVAPGRLDADSAWGRLVHMLRLHGRTDPPQIGDAPPDEVTFEYVLQGGRRKARPVRRPGPPGWRLADDPDTCAAMEAGLSALGGWRALAESEEGLLAPTFRRAFDASRAERERETASRLLGWQAVPQIVGGPTLSVLPGGKR